MFKHDSKHGFHVHAVGDCSDPEFKKAGGHFNPTGEAHGAPQAPAHHLGDLGNLTADARGEVKQEKTISGLDLKNSGLIGKSVIVHEKADDLKTQPSGDSGGRLACGVIATSMQ